jgi:hypothetical protein
MQSCPACEKTAEKAVFHDEVVQAHVHDLEARLAERVRASPLHHEEDRASHAPGWSALVRDELARAELAGEISEFHALNYQAILAVVERSELASDYLEMARAAASSPYELAVIAENQATHDLLQGNPFAAAEQCLATLDQVYQTEGLWNHLLIALYHLGEMEAFDAALHLQR